MENMPIFNTLSYKIFFSVAQEYVEKYDVDNIEPADEPQTAVPEPEPEPRPAPKAYIPQAAAPEEPGLPVYDVEPEPNNNTRNIIIAILALIVAGAAAWFAFAGGSGKNNPLGVQKPKWEKFVAVKTDGVRLYKEADTSSPGLQIVIELMDGCMPREKLLWQGDKAPRGYDVNDYDVYFGRVFPVIDESDSWYRVHIGTGEIREAYLQKESCEEVKPEPITKEIIDKVKTGEWSRLVEKGEFANLYLERDHDGEWGETIVAGVLMEGCIIIPNGCCFHPLNTDTTEVGMRNVSGSPDYNRWQMECPAKYWKESDEEIDPTFDVNLLDDNDLRKVVMAIRPTDDTGSTVLYYFPSVATDRFIEFEYSFSPAAVSEAEEDETPQHVTGYKCVKEDDECQLVALFGDNEVKTGMTAMVDYGILEVVDLDGDGNMECLLAELGGGNMEENRTPFVVCYDSEADKFIETEHMRYYADTEKEEWKGQTTYVQRHGLRKVRYAYSKGKLDIVENEVKQFGTARVTIDLDNLYGTDEEGKKSVTADIDGDGTYEFLNITRGMSHAEGYGLMNLRSIATSDGQEIEVDRIAETFKILEENTNGLPDIIADDWLLRWNGTGYDRWEWDGKNIVKCTI